MLQSCPHLLLRTKRNQKKSRVSHVERVEKVEDFCAPAWFLEFMAALETPKEALEVDDQVTDPSQDPIAEPRKNQSQKDDDYPA